MTIDKLELERRKRAQLYNYLTTQAFSDNVKSGKFDKVQTDLFNRVGTVGHRSLQDLSSSGSKESQIYFNSSTATSKDLLQKNQVNTAKKSPSLKAFISPDSYV